MDLTKTERERITDSARKIQSVRASLNHIDKGKIPNREAMEECLDDTDQSLREALGYSNPSSEHR